MLALCDVAELPAERVRMGVTNFFSALCAGTERDWSASKIS
jgi:hypothetical protein